MKKLILISGVVFLSLFIFVKYKTNTNPYYQGSKTAHFDGVRFNNLDPVQSHSFSDFVKWRLNRNKGVWPPVFSEVVFDVPPEKVEREDLRVTFVGHSTVLIQTESLNILTDPIWSGFASPVSGVGPQRIQLPGILFNKIPKIDLILVSHSHYDHLDLPTIRRLVRRDDPMIVVPLGNDVIIQQEDATARIKALDWGESYAATDLVNIYLQPVQHWSARTMWDHNKALWGSFVIETPGGNIYFAGDTGYGEGYNFIRTQKEFGQFRLALLPIGAYKPRWFMEHNHLNPEEAVLAHKKLNAKQSLGIHFGCFKYLADDGYEEPVDDLREAKREHHLNDADFRVLKVGGSWDVLK